MPIIREEEKMSLKPKLISFKLCPYVQRSVITLLEKKVPHDIEYIDLENKPDWFLKISPLGKVPVLVVNDRVLFESAVINEYLDETNPPSLHPSDAFDKAENRAYIEFVSSLLVHFYLLSTSKDEQTFEAKKKDLANGLSRLEQLIKLPFFNGEKLSLLDTSTAPLLTRLLLIEKNTGIQLIPDELKKVRSYAEKVTSLDSVKKSVVSDFESLFVGYLKKKSEYLATRLT